MTEQSKNWIAYLSFMDWGPMYIIPIEHWPKQSTPTISNEHFFLISRQELVVTVGFPGAYWGMAGWDGVCVHATLSHHIHA